MSSDQLLLECRDVVRGRLAQQCSGLARPSCDFVEGARKSPPGKGFFGRCNAPDTLILLRNRRRSLTWHDR